MDSVRKVVSPKSQSSFNGMPSLTFSDSDVELLSKPLDLALVGKFSFGIPKIFDVTSMLRDQKLKTGFTVSFMDSRNVLIKLFCEEDFNQLWLLDSPNVQGFPLRFFKWSPLFSIEDESPIVPVWVSFEKLPVFLFDKEALYEIGKLIGKLVKLDGYTANRSKLNQATICIEVDVSKPLIRHVWLQVLGKGVAIKVSYSKVPHFCTACKKLGHLESNCLGLVNREEEVLLNSGMEKGTEVHVAPSLGEDTNGSILGRGPSSFVPRRGRWNGGRGTGGRGGRGGRGDFCVNYTPNLPVATGTPVVSLPPPSSVNAFAILSEQVASEVIPSVSDEEEVEVVFDESLVFPIEREVPVSPVPSLVPIITSVSVPGVPEFEPILCNAVRSRSLDLTHDVTPIHRSGSSSQAERDNEVIRWATVSTGPSRNGEDDLSEDSVEDNSSFESKVCSPSPPAKNTRRRKTFKAVGNSISQKPQTKLGRRRTGKKASPSSKC